MKRALWIVVAACCVWCWGAAAAETPGDDGLWRLVAIPALVKRLDDSRRIKARQLYFHTSGGFEGIAHYSPDVVTDVLATVLPGIAHESFGQIQSGGSDQERREVIDAWRVYLYHLENGLPSAEQGTPGPGKSRLIPARGLSRRAGIV